MTALPLRPGEITALAEALATCGRVRVPLHELWPLWAAAAPRLVGDPDQVAGLAQALAELSQQRAVELPKEAWDASTTPPLPRSILVPAARRTSRPRSWVRHPWGPELGWVASQPTLSATQHNDLVTINEWLIHNRGRDVPVVPMRYRSVELFGNEKHLEALSRTSLFAPGRLNLDMLCCVRRPPPLAAAVVGPGTDALVIENSDTYWAAVDILRYLDGHPVGIVAWGAGRAFPSQAETLKIDVAGRGPVQGTVWYWGDLDPDGLAIATDAAAATAAIDGPPVLPAIHLWHAMADRSIQNRGTIDWSASAGETWLGPNLWMRLADVRAANGRIAQEAIAPSVIGDWALRAR
jgi:hypothetical protein